MARLTKEQWEKARAEYEVRGISLREVARQYGVSDVAVGKRASKEGWRQGKSLHLVEKKMAIVKAQAEYEAESSQLSLTTRWTVESVAAEKLRAEGLLAKFGEMLAQKGMELAQRATSPEELEILARAHRNIAPQTSREATTVNISQQQGAMIKADSPRDVLAELTRQAMEYDLEFEKEQK